MTLPVSALEITAPRVPASGEANMPVQTESFGDGLLELFQKALDLFMPDLKEAAQVCGLSRHEGGHLRLWRRR